MTHVRMRRGGRSGGSVCIARVVSPQPGAAVRARDLPAPRPVSSGTRRTSDAGRLGMCGPQGAGTAKGSRCEGMPGAGGRRRPPGGPSSAGLGPGARGPAPLTLPSFPEARSRRDAEQHRARSGRGGSRVLPPAAAGFGAALRRQWGSYLEFRDEVKAVRQGKERLQLLPHH